MMREHHDSESKNGLDPKTETPKKNNNKKKIEFEFCKVYNINHDNGLRHKYFPNHKNSLSTFLSRFRNKLSCSKSYASYACTMVTGLRHRLEVGLQ